MTDLVSAIVCFFAGFFVHWMTYAPLRRCGITGFKTFVVYGVFLVIHLWGMQYRESVIPVVSSLIYIGMTLYVGIFFLTASRGQFGPSTKMHFLVAKKKGATRKELLKMFDKENLIGLRMNSLLDDGLVRKKSERLYITYEGKRVIRWISLYRRLLRWESTG